MPAIRRPLNGSLTSVLAALPAGVGLWLSFPDFSLFPVAWLALVPYLIFLLALPSWKQLLASHFLLCTVYFGGVLYWIPQVLTEYGNLNSLVALPVFVLLIEVMGCFLLPFSLITRWLAGRSAGLALWCAPGLWLLTEILRNDFGADGFPWAALGYSQYPFSWMLQTADLGSVYLISFLIVFVNCGLAALLLRTRTRLPAVALLLVLGASGYGFYRLHYWVPPDGQALRVALVQPNIALSKDREYYARRYFEDLPRYYDRAVAEGARWVIFPEAPNPFVFNRDFYFTTFWERRVQETGVPLLLNANRLEQGEARVHFNSAFLLSAEEGPGYHYDKIHLVPFGEYVPYRRLLGFAQPLVQQVGGFQAGTGNVDPGRVQGNAFGTLICYESIFPELSRRLVRKGAAVLVNITNDAWFGTTAAPRQHLEMAAFRAVEQRKTLLRCANSGYSAVVDAHGRIQQKLDLFEDGLLVADVQVNQYRSIYSGLGGWLPLSIIIGTLVGVAVGSRSRFAV